MPFYYLPISVFIISLCASYFLRFTPPIIALVYFLLSIVTFYLYYKDKRAAKEGLWRVSEDTLHIIALLGGWPGAIMGQYIFRHKTQKLRFRVVFYLTLLINLTVFVGLHTPYGQKPFRSAVYNSEYWIVNTFGDHELVIIALRLTRFRLL